MTPQSILLIVALYFLVLIVIARLSAEKGANFDFFLGSKKSPWYVVAFGMIGASLSGVTFISVPGWVGSSQFSYMQMVLGYLLGYLVVANILLPLYYKLNLTSIYTYLEQRFGFWSHKSGSSFFLISRIIGAAFRLYLVAMIFQYAVFDPLGFDMPFALTVAITIALIWLYTFRGGIKTIIWTDTLQTTFMLAAVVVGVYFIYDQLAVEGGSILKTVTESEYSRIFFFDDWKDSRFFLKQFLSGAFITIVMTGLDQDMMQKNLSCKNLGDAKKNMYWFSIILVFVNFIFLSLGALLYLFAAEKGINIPEKADYLFPMIALEGYLPEIVGVFFILGLIAAAYSSADSALTSLTTAFCVDFLGLDKKEGKNDKRTRTLVHLGFSIVLLAVIIWFKSINDDSVISELFVAAGYTYGPLLGMFAFGLFTNYEVKDKWVPFICVVSPMICYFLKDNSDWLLGGYQFGYELLILNGILCFTGLFLIKQKSMIQKS